MTLRNVENHRTVYPTSSIHSFRSSHALSLHNPLVRHSIRLWPNRHGGCRVDRHRRNGRRRNLLDPRRGGAGGRQRHVARLCDRRRGGALVHLFLRQARRRLSLRRRCRELSGEGIRRRHIRGRSQPVHVGRLHHLARPLCDGLRQLRRHLHHRDTLGIAAQIAGDWFGSLGDGGERFRRQNHGAGGDDHRCHQVGNPRRVRSHGAVVHQTGEPLARPMAADSIDPVRRRRPFHRI